MALTDSPVGLLAWLTQLLDQWSDDEIQADDLLAGASLMWLTNTVRSSMRLYSEPAGAWDSTDWTDDAAESVDAESATPGSDAWAPVPIQTPTAFALFPKDLGMAPRALADRHFAVERFTVMPRGGHFAAIEQPALLAEDLLAFLEGRS